MTTNVTHGFYAIARRRTGELAWYGVIVSPRGEWSFSCVHAHLTTVSARACARVELEDRQRAWRRQQHREVGP